MNDFPLGFLKQTTTRECMQRGCIGLCSLGSSQARVAGEMDRPSNTLSLQLGVVTGSTPESTQNIFMDCKMKSRTRLWDNPIFREKSALLYFSTKNYKRFSKNEGFVCFYAPEDVTRKEGFDCFYTPKILKLNPYKHFFELSPSSLF